MGIPFTMNMGFLLTAAMGNLLTMTLGIHLAISSFTLKAPKIHVNDTASRVKLTVLAKVK